jgi:hypothetical protein
MEGQVPEAARDGAIEGIGGISFELTDGDHGDAEVSFDITEPDSFFYDPEVLPGRLHRRHVHGRGQVARPGHRG